MARSPKSDFVKHRHKSATNGNEPATIELPNHDVIRVPEVPGQPITPIVPVETRKESPQDTPKTTVVSSLKRKLSYEEILFFYQQNNNRK